MKKKIISIMLVLTMAFGVCGTAWAVESEDVIAPLKFQSHGKITFQNGKDAVVIDSQDFYKLEGRMNQFKQGVADQLGAMKTYFTTGDGVSVKTDADVRVGHKEPSADQAVDPVSVDFGTILEGIAASQSVPSDVTVYDYPAGTQLYKNASGMLTTDGSAKGAEKIDVTAATAANLSAGTAAWVDGKLVLGTGGDNKSYYDQGGGFKKAKVTLNYRVTLWSGSCGPDSDTPSNTSSTLTISCIITNNNGHLNIAVSTNYPHVYGVYSSQGIAAYINYIGGTIEILEK